MAHHFARLTIRSPASPTHLLLVDGSSYLYRAFNALPPLHTRAGEPTGALYGVINMLRQLQTHFQPSHQAVIFDTPAKTFRHEILASYKAQRPPMPPELACQIAPLMMLIEALGWTRLQIEGVEADDVIATLAKRAVQQRIPVLIASGDKDLAQLVTDQITLFDPLNQQRMDVAAVVTRFGVPPTLLVDYLALIGDRSDNIPGVMGVGPKTAAKWLNHYGSLEALLADAAAVAGKVGENLRASVGQVLLNQQLIRLREDVPLNLSIVDLAAKSPNHSALRTLYQRYEFKSWLKQLGNENHPEEVAEQTHQAEIHPHSPSVQGGAETPPATSLTKGGTESGEIPLPPSTLHDAAALAHWLAEVPWIAVAQSSEGDIAIARSEAESLYIPRNTHDLDTVLKLLNDPNRIRVGHNVKLFAFQSADLLIKELHHDVMLQAYILDASTDSPNFESLADLQRHYLHHLHLCDADLQVAQPNQPDQQTADQARTIYALHNVLWQRLQPETRCTLYQQVEMPLTGVLARMERHGVMVDVAALQQYSLQVGQQLHALEQQAYDLAGQAFNINSPKQLRTIFTQQGLPILQKTPKGQPSTSESVLQELAIHSPLAAVISDYRHLSKLKSTYLDALPRQINPRTGRLHTSYHQAVVSTGRLSSSNPNLQNIPIRTPEGRRIRQTFVAPTGYQLVAADYSQIELRVMAHLSNDAGLLAAFARGDDVHRATAAEVFGVPVAQVSDAQRRAAKSINFGLIYGMSAFGLARQLGITQKVAQDYIERYFIRFVGVKTFMDDVRKRALMQGYVETLFGRRLYLPQLRASHAHQRQAAERTAINAPLQGSAADIIKRAMVAIDRWLHTTPINAALIMQVHDELVFEVAEAQVDSFIKPVRQLMMEAACLQVPLEVAVGVGRNWDEAH